MSGIFQLTVCGTRGSMATSRAETAVFGGDTSCYMVRAGDETIFLDAGSGIVSAPARYEKPPVILLSHLHLDHVIGLGMFPGFTVPGQKARLFIPFCKDREEASARMARVFSPPFWPLRLDEMEGRPELLPLPQSLRIGDVLAETADGSHPNGSKLIRLSFDGRRIVYATDFEHTEPAFARLIDFAEDADLLLYDGQFTDEEYPEKRGFGHSTIRKGEELMRRSGAKKLLLIHHAPASTDDVLLRRESSFDGDAIRFAREGDVINVGQTGRSR